MSNPYSQPSPQPLGPQYQPTQYGQPQFQPPQPPPQKSGCGCGLPILLGCLGVGVIGVLLCAGGVFYVQQNADKWVAGLGREVIVATINSSDIPAQEKTEVIAQVDRVVDAYKAREIDQQDLQRILEEFQDSPIFTMIGAWGAEKAYLDTSGLSDEEKTDGRRQIERALRGLLEKKITQDQFSAIIPQKNATTTTTTTEYNPDGTPKTTKTETIGNEPVTDDDVRMMIGKLKQLADDAQIPDEPFTVDIGDEVKKVIDAALEENQGH